MIGGSYTRWARRRSGPGPQSRRWGGGPREPEAKATPDEQ
jgi:hypothetical protein